MWTTNTYEETINIYRDYVEKRLDKVDLELSLKDILIRIEILKRNFTKRQSNIVLFIYTFSIKIYKEKALIPNMQDFELCGVNKNKIKSELEKLVEMNVIDWDRGSQEFRLKDPQDWNAPYHYGYNENRLQELLKINIADEEGFTITL
ncbi:replication protein [Bacillus atrophaeus]|uniref:replication protein n=1 Tax=Bacillus atrophaeus TaxID=1452 RepID=UPI00227F4CE7|nr:replication protein [Bacillus atrophaeus]MCY7947977.1 replication protein [Bacillus atrophaeus]MCY8098077.1 replication protein [Bacillus atrophaeus]MCY9170001.1 replication protein [Bacillus atrophaeus]MEC0740727.1 replication protein [Bacillus atrophaeus]MEC0747010.1 replication protein [Bacillus atrophaeus]